MLCLRCISSVVVFVFGWECVERAEYQSSSGSPHTVHLLRGFELTATVFTWSWLWLYFCSPAWKGLWSGSTVYKYVNNRRQRTFFSTKHPPTWERIPQYQQFLDQNASPHFQLFIVSFSGALWPTFQTVVWFECWVSNSSPSLLCVCRSTYICFLQLRVIVTEPCWLHSWGVCVCVVMSVFSPCTTYFTLSRLFSCIGRRQWWRAIVLQRDQWEYNPCEQDACQLCQSTPLLFPPNYVTSWNVVKAFRWFMEDKTSDPKKYQLTNASALCLNTV